MDITVLKYFQVVAQTQHMTRAAQQLHISQPSLTAAIRKLETEVGTPLFDRHGRSIRLNECGRIYLKEVTAALEHLKHAQTQISEAKGRSTRKLRLALPGSDTASPLVDMLIRRFYNISIFSVHNIKKEDLVNNRVDLVMTHAKIDNPMIESTPLLRNHRLLVVCHRDHPLASQEHIGIQDLCAYPFAASNYDMAPDHVWEEEFRRVGFYPYIAFQGDSVFDRVRAVTVGHYLTVMMEPYFKRYATDDMVWLNVENFSYQMDFFLYWRKTDRSDSALMEMRDFIINYFQHEDTVP